MKLSNDFLLRSELAQEIYHELKEVPIIDFHNHISLRDLYKNKPYASITELWLSTDSEKWRLMRNSGILEYQITGNDSDENKFKAYAKALEHAYLNPLYQWTHMELQEYFGITEALTSENASEVYKKINEQLTKEETGPRDLLKKNNVEVLFTTNELTDDLEYHTLIQEDEGCSVKVLPTFSPDVLFDFNSDSFFDVITLLERQTATTITGITSLATALSKRLDFFQEKGCVAADHIIGTILYGNVPKSMASKVLKKRLQKERLTRIEEQQLTLYILKFFFKEYAIRDMVCQLHIGALRNTNSRMVAELGTDSGYDSISTKPFVDELAKLLDEIHSHYPLPKMIIYSLNQEDDEALASLCASFSCQSPGKIQLGAAAWFNNHEAGIKRHLETYSTFLNLSTFVGTVTDSRYVTSFVKHDYFRRILADWFASNVEAGRFPNNKNALIQVAKDICYNNSRYYFNI